MTRDERRYASDIRPRHRRAADGASGGRACPGPLSPARRIPYPAGQYPAGRGAGPEGGARILAKYEFGNPFGSIKDRAAYALVRSAIDRHDPQGPPLKLVDFSGGNFAAALGGLGALTGIPIRLAVPDAMPPSVLNRLRANGVQIDLVPAAEFLYGIIRRSAMIAAEDPSWTRDWARAAGDP
jgi:cysteine synthase